MFRAAYQRVRRATIRITIQTCVVVGVVEATTHLPSQGRSSETYHYLSDECVTPLLRKFLDPESAHEVALYMTQRGWAPLHRPSAAEQRVRMETSPWSGRSSRSSSNNTNNSGTGTGTALTSKPLTFPNPIGLAAGFDKDGVVTKEMLQLGFGFVEIGTVTPLPQPGNPKPRLWRLSHDEAIVNRYGFNSAGSSVVKNNLQRFRNNISENSNKSRTTAATTTSSQSSVPERESDASATTTTTKTSSLGQAIWNAVRPYLFTYPSSSVTSISGLVGVNIGKNKATQGDEAVISDYVSNLECLGPLADFCVINISSPNTPGLKEVQTKPLFLKKLLRACLECRDRTCPNVPLLVKLSPDLNQEQLHEIAQLCMQLNLDGLVVCNTTTTMRPSDLISWKLQPPSQLPPTSSSSSVPSTSSSSSSNEEIEADDTAATTPTSTVVTVGGLSGAPLKDTSTECIRTLFQATEGKIPIIGVGGVGSGRDAMEKFQAGASLVQVYSAMVYKGPGVVSRIRKELAELMLQNGVRSVEELVGLDHEQLYWERREERMRLQRRRDSRIVVASLSTDAEDNSNSNEPEPLQ